MADDQNEIPHVVSFPEPRVGAVRDAEERRRVAEIAREIEDLGRALEGRDRVAGLGTAERAKTFRAPSAGAVGDPSPPEPKPLPTVADISSSPKEVSPRVGKFAAITAIPQQRKLVAEGGPPTGRRKWGPLPAAVIIVLSLVSGGALMLMGAPIEIQDAYRSAVAEMQRLTARQSAETEAAARKAADEKLAAVAAARRHEEEARQAAEEKAKAEAARQMAEADARAAAQEAAKRQAAEERAKAEAARQMAEADARAAAQEAAKRQAAEERAKAEAAADARAAAREVPTAPLSDVPTSRRSESSPSEIVEVQTRLEALGMNPGPLDGNLGPRTIRAIKRYEEANGRPQTGNIDREILGRLRQEKPISQAESASRKAAAPSAAAGADKLYNDAFKKLQEGEYAGAERGFRAFLQSNPKHVLAGNAQYWLGDTYYARRDYQNAMTAFAEGDKVYKASPKGPDNLLKLGLTLAALGRKPDACAVFAKFNQDYPRATDLQKRRVEQERHKNGCG
jgi:tol-pal system protein YbgF